MAEEWGNYLVLYLYDADGSPVGMQYRNTSYAEGTFDTYWFEKNLQGDVVAVYNHSGIKLIAYTYDAWGNSSVSYYNSGASTTATYNPFRYRGYYLDSESGFYYLNNILTEKIIASNMSWTGWGAVRFTECPWTSRLDHTEKYSSYGIVFEKSFVFSRNGGPVYYVRADQYEKQAWHEHLKPFVTPFWPAYIPKKKKAK